MNQKIFFRFLIFSIFTVLPIIPIKGQAFTFSKDLLITDRELEDNSALSLKGIKNFLAENGSVLADYQTEDTDGMMKPVAQIIQNVANAYFLNPMLFLVMAQKESSAITQSQMTTPIMDWLLGFGRCDGCAEEDAAEYRGIARQLHAAGDRFRNGYLHDLATRGYTISGWGRGITKTTIDGIAVTPENNATAALYTYNPCVGAYGGGTPSFGCNSAFQKLWQEWNPDVYYPNGSLLQINRVVYLIQNGSKRPFSSKAALLSSYNLRDIISVPSTVGEKYPEGDAIHFPNYSFLRNPAGTVYLYVDGKRRGVKSQEVLRQLGIHPEEIQPVEWREINNIPEAKPITLKSTNPRGTLYQDNTTGAVFFVDNKNKRHPIPDRTILIQRFPHRILQRITPNELEEFPLSDPLTLRDGTLVRAPKDSHVYIISDGMRRAFASREIFDRYGYQWRNIITVSKKILDLHPEGEPVKLKKSS